MTITINGTTGISGVDGSAGTPSLQGQDTNTGFFYGTDILGFSTGGSERMRIDSAGNLGLGVTPSAWTFGKAVQVQSASFTGQNGVNAAYMNANAYYGSGAWTYINSDYATSYRQYNGTHSWSTAPSGTAGNAITFTQAMTLDASGNLGVGTSSLSSKLVVNGGTGTSQIRFEVSNASYTQEVSTNAAQNAYVYKSNDASYHVWKASSSEVMRIDSSGNLLLGISTVPGAFNKNLVIDGGATTYAGIQIVNNNTGRLYNNGAVFYIDSSNNVSISNNNAGVLVFATNGIERVRIASDGKVSVGATAVINNDAQMSIRNASGQYVLYSDAQTQYSGSYRHIRFWAAGNVAGDITSTTTTTTYGTTSDYRLKENIKPMTGVLEKIAQLKPVTYTWKADGSDGQGFIAHELQAVVPDCVTGEKDAVDEDGNPVYQGIDTSFLVATLTKAIQELTARVIELEKK